MAMPKINIVLMISLAVWAAGSNPRVPVQSDGGKFHGIRTAGPTR
jgi:hypothetical protein